MSYQSKFEEIAEKQGFEEPLDESPVDFPEDTWKGGDVCQTGGWILCRIWRTREVNDPHAPQYEVIYGDGGGVSVNKYVYDDDLDSHTFSEEVEVTSVSENTDQRKAEVAKEMMENFDREDYQ